MEQFEVDYVNKNRDKYIVKTVYNNYNNLEVLVIPIAEFEPELVPSGYGKILKKV